MSKKSGRRGTLKKPPPHPFMTVETGSWDSQQPLIITVKSGRLIFPTGTKQIICLGKHLGHYKISYSPVPLRSTTRNLTWQHFRHLVFNLTGISMTQS